MEHITYEQVLSPYLHHDDKTPDHAKDQGPGQLHLDTHDDLQCVDASTAVRRKVIIECT